MVTIKGGKLKGGTTKKKKHYMDDRKPQQMRAEPDTKKKVGPPKKLEGALNQPKAKPKSKGKSNTGPNKVTYGQLMDKKPKAKPSRSSKPMSSSIPKAQGKAPTNRRETSISISRETMPGKVLGFIVSGSASRTDEDRKKRARAIRASQK